jgi:hypothetical protein
VNARDLLDTPRRELAALMASGRAFDPADIADHEYRGISLGLPAWIERLTWKKFTKAFRRHPDGRIRGWNVRIVQDGLDRPWRAMEKRGAPITFGHFDVVARRDGVVLDYGLLEDPLVALRDGSSDLLLGRSLLDLGVTRLGTPSYFVLERGDRL